MINSGTQARKHIYTHIHIQIDRHKNTHTHISFKTGLHVHAGGKQETTGPSKVSWQDAQALTGAHIHGFAGISTILSPRAPCLLPRHPPPLFFPSLFPPPPERLPGPSPLLPHVPILAPSVVDRAYSLPLVDVASLTLLLSNECFSYLIILYSYCTSPTYLHPPPVHNKEPCLRFSAYFLLRIHRPLLGSPPSSAQESPSGVLSTSHIPFATSSFP